MTENPGVDEGIGEVVAEFRIGRPEIGAEFVDERQDGRAWWDAVVIFNDVAPELAVVGGGWVGRAWLLAGLGDCGKGCEQAQEDD